MKLFKKIIWQYSSVSTFSHSPIGGDTGDVEKRSPVLSPVSDPKILSFTCARAQKHTHTHTQHEVYVCHIDSHTFCYNHRSAYRRQPPPRPPLHPTPLIKAERLQKVGANNKATYYIEVASFPNTLSIIHVIRVSTRKRCFFSSQKAWDKYHLSSGLIVSKEVWVTIHTKSAPAS